MSYKAPPDRGSVLGNLLGLVGDTVTVWEVPLEGGRGYFPVGLKTESGPVAPLMFPLFPPSLLLLFWGPFWGISINPHGFDWIPTSWGLFHSSLQGPEPNPIIALCLPQTGSSPASIPRDTWCTFHKLGWLPYPVKLQQVSGSHLLEKKKKKLGTI